MENVLPTKIQLVAPEISRSLQYKNIYIHHEKLLFSQSCSNYISDVYVRWIVDAEISSSYWFSTTMSRVTKINHYITNIQSGNIGTFIQLFKLRCGHPRKSNEFNLFLPSLLINLCSQVKTLMMWVECTSSISIHHISWVLNFFPLFDNIFAISL